MLEKKINSANIEKVGWINGLLTIYFTSGEVVVYSFVPEGIYAGLCGAVSTGTFLNRYIVGEFNYTKERDCDDAHKIKKLEHHEASTVGLWATDKPGIIPEDIKDYFFRIDRST